MTDTLDGFALWIVEFKKEGLPTDQGSVDRFVTDVASQGVTDVFVFSHGWNNDKATALSLYHRFFGEMTKVLNDAQTPKRKTDAKVGLVGVVWPSMLWPDDAASAAMPVVAAPAGGPAASVSGMPAPSAAGVAIPTAVNSELKKVYDQSEQQSLIDELTTLLQDQPKTDEALRVFKDKLAALLTSESPSDPSDRKLPDSAEGAITQLTDNQWRELLDTLGILAAQRGGMAGGGVGIGDPFKKLWAGAKDAMRIATYWQMKQRAGIVGRNGLGAVVTRLAREAPKTHVHLLGHSFGARLVSFSLAGLPAEAAETSSPVKSLFLLQGAFSHYAFADKLPHDASRSGALKGMARFVDGPLITTHSRRDLAVGLSYPAASFVNRDDAAAAIDQSVRFGAMGHDGAQAVNAAGTSLGPPGTGYSFEKGKWLNLDGNSVIIHGGLPSGAHSDIVHPHTAWAALAAAGLV